jgi:hypothetical protein
LLPALIAFVQVGTALGGDRITGATQYDERALCIAVGNMYGLDPDLLRAIAKIESGGDARARSAAGALGLMQLMPETALRFRVTDPFDPVENVLGAARFIEYLRQSHGVDGRALELPEQNCLQHTTRAKERLIVTEESRRIPRPRDTSTRYFGCTLSARLRPRPAPSTLQARTGDPR